MARDLLQSTTLMPPECLQHQHHLLQVLPHASNKILMQLLLQFVQLSKLPETSHLYRENGNALHKFTRGLATPAALSKRRERQEKSVYPPRLPRCRWQWKVTICRAATFSSTATRTHTVRDEQSHPHAKPTKILPNPCVVEDPNDLLLHSLLPSLTYSSHIFLDLPLHSNPPHTPHAHTNSFTFSPHHSSSLCDGKNNKISNGTTYPLIRLI